MRQTVSPQPRLSLNLSQEKKKPQADGSINITTPGALSVDFINTSASESKVIRKFKNRMRATVDLLPNMSLKKHYPEFSKEFSRKDAATEAIKELS